MSSQPITRLLFSTSGRLVQATLVGLAAAAAAPGVYSQYWAACDDDGACHSQSPPHAATPRSSISYEVEVRRSTQDQYLSTMLNPW